MIASLGLLLTNCASQTYKIKKEGNKTVTKGPAWYMADIAEKEACNKKRFGKTKNKECIYGVGTAVSPSLELAIDKAKMIAKAEMADIIQGEMNKRAELYITEVGQENNKQVVTKVESTIVNIISKTKVQGYEEWNKAVYETGDGQYRDLDGEEMEKKSALKKIREGEYESAFRKKQGQKTAELSEGPPSLCVYGDS